MYCLSMRLFRIQIGLWSAGLFNCPGSYLIHEDVGAADRLGQAIASTRIEDDPHRAGESHPVARRDVNGLYSLAGSDHGPDCSALVLQLHPGSFLGRYSIVPPDESRLCAAHRRRVEE